MARRMQSRAGALAALGGIGASLLVPGVVRAQTPAVLNVAGVPEDSITAALYADQSGLFAKNGLAVKLSSERSGSAIASGVAGGAYQIAKSSLVSLILARGRGIPFVLVAPGGYYSSSSPNTAMLVAKESSLKSAADLNGKTVAVSALGDLYTLSTKEWMAKNGGDPDSIKLVELPISAVPDAVAAGRIDAGMVIEPVLERAIEGGKIRVIAHPMDAIASRFLYSGWFTTSDWATAHPKETVAFAKAMRDASAYVNAHEGQTVDLLAKFSGIDPSDIAKMVRAESATALNPKEIQPVIDACVRYKLIATAFDARDMIKTP
jgi:NitT/TauT family transport system substrate-binding protein